jgi:hypothetical protein
MASEDYYKLTFKGFLAVRLMEFDYNGRHFSYHGKWRMLWSSLPQNRGRLYLRSKLVVHGQAVYAWSPDGRGTRGPLAGCALPSS